MVQLCEEKNGSFIYASNFSLGVNVFLGYGKMGKVIERIALERGHEIVLKKDQNNTFEGLSIADVAIDFSVPDSAVANISECLNNGIPVISGTTGDRKSVV